MRLGVQKMGVESELWTIFGDLLIGFLEIVFCGMCAELNMLLQAKCYSS